jgi:ketosteroid isomerase-like protein
VTPAETKREMVRRMRAKDLIGAMELIADDAVYFWSNGSAMFGKPAIEAAMKTNFDAFVGDTYDVHDVTWVAESEDVAACVFRFEWTAVIDGQPASGRGRGASVLKRVDREWRIVHENLSQGRWKARRGSVSV